MNTIRRKRKRPRVRSVSFRAFAWVLMREATLRVVCSADDRSGRVSFWRAQLARSDAARCRALVARCLVLFPYRRFVP